MASYPVKFYHQGMTGAPTISTAFGELTTLLDACLVNGFNLKTVTSITSSGTVAELTCPNHGFIKDQIILISGCDQPEYNGEQRVTFVSTNTLTFDCVAGGVTPATGTMTVKTAPLGFEIAFTGTQRRAYRSQNVLSNRFYLYVDDSQDPLYTGTYAKKGKVMVAESMLDINTVTPGSMQMPYDAATPSDRSRLKATGSGTTVVDGWFKWYYSKADSWTTGDTTAPTAGTHDWTLIGDDRGFYFMPTWSPSQYSGTTTRACYTFTDFDSYWPGDVNNTFLGASEWLNVVASSYTSSAGGTVGTGQGQNWMRSCYDTGNAVMRNHTQTGTPIYVGLTTINNNNSWQASGCIGGATYPSGPGYGLFITPTYIRQTSDAMLRGVMPGLMWVHSNITPTSNTVSSTVLQNNEIIENITGYTGKKFMAHQIMPTGNTSTTWYLGRQLIDITGPWH